MITTKICEILGIKYPIIQGGMAYVATAELAAAVSNAGALGIIGTGMMNAEEVRKEIRRTKELTSKPFGVNVLLLNPQVKEIMEVIVEEKVKVITTGAGNPGVYIPMLLSAGVKVIPVVSSVALARRLQRYNISAIVGEGEEAGGHIGDITTLALIPQLVDAIKIPVIAAGGIADGRGLVASLALGAEGVQIGTRFICAEECIAHSNYKMAIIKATDRDTEVTGRSIGHPVRCIRNRLTREFEELEKKGASKEEIETLGIGKLRDAVLKGDIEYGSLMAGQSAALVKKIQPAKEIIEEIMEEAIRILKKLSSEFKL